MSDIQRQDVYDKDYSTGGEHKGVFQHVCFALDDQQYGINVENVIEVISIPEITNVIHTPDFIKGIINLRGDIIAVIDLKGFFSLRETELHEKSKIVRKNGGIPDERGQSERTAAHDPQSAEPVQRGRVQAVRMRRAARPRKYKTRTIT